MLRRSPSPLSPPGRPPTLSEHVLHELRRQFARGRFAPGERIGVDRLAAEFEVSPLPVREALRVLLAEGRVDYSSHRGYRATRLTLADVEEMFLICGLLEAEALRRGVPAMDDAAVARMRSLLESLEALPAAAQLWDAVSVHQGFHFVPFEQARLSRLTAELRKLWDHTDHYRALFLFQNEIAHRALQDEHRLLFDACAARDAERATELMNEHRRHAIGWLAQGFGNDEGAAR